MVWFKRTEALEQQEQPLPDEEIPLTSYSGIYPLKYAANAEKVLSNYGITTLADLKRLLSSPIAKEIQQEKALKKLNKAKEEYETLLKEVNG